jgi:hypothetical protein
MFKISTGFILVLLTIICASSTGQQDIVNRFFDFIKDPQNEKQLKTLYCKKFKIENCDRDFNQIKQAVFNNFPSFNQTSSKNVKRKTVIALEGSKQRNNNPLAALIPLIALLANNNDEMPILPPQRQSNIDLSLLQQPPNPQPVTCCSQPSLLQPLPQFVTIVQTYSYGIIGLVNEVQDGKISCPKIDTSICSVPSIISIINAAVSGDLPPAGGDGTCSFPANPTGLISPICNGRNECSCGPTIAQSILTQNCQLALSAEFNTTSGINAVVHTTRIDIQYQCVNSCQFQG